MNSPKQLMHSLHSFPFGGVGGKVGELIEVFCPFMVTTSQIQIMNFILADL